jgi:hypothetical protein
VPKNASLCRGIHTPPWAAEGQGQRRSQGAQRFKDFVTSFIRTGTNRIRIARGSTFIPGDGSGKPIAVRLTSLAAEFGVLPDPASGSATYDLKRSCRLGHFTLLPASLLKTSKGGVAGLWVNKKLAPQRTMNDINGPSPLMKTCSGSE